MIEQNTAGLADEHAVTWEQIEQVEARIDNLRNVADRFDHPGGSRRLAQRAHDKADGMEVALRLLGVTERGVLGDPASNPATVAAVYRQEADRG